MLRCSAVSLRNDVVGHLRQFGDVGGMSAYPPVATELLRRSTVAPGAYPHEAMLLCAAAWQLDEVRGRAGA
jgi:hypothetical protein